MRQKYLFFFFALFALSILSSCEREEINEVLYKGNVIDSVSREPFPNLEVSVTNGENIYTSVHTDAKGDFSLTVKVNEVVYGGYYLLVGDSSCVPVRKELIGLGARPEIDLGIIEVAGPKAPRVTTDTVFSHKAGTAVCRANVEDGGRAFVTARGVCWSSEEQYPTKESCGDQFTTEGTGEGEFESNITGLGFEKTYYFRAYATNRIGTTYGEPIAFITGTGKVQVETDTVFAVYATSAKCTGTIVKVGDFEILSCGICWGMTPDPTVEESISYASVKSGSFECSMRNLNVSTTYYVRAFAENINGHAYGRCLPVITLSGKPIVSIGEPTAKATSISVSGTIEDNGGFAITERGICYSTSNTEPTIDGDKIQSDYGDGSFDVYIGGLEHSTTYYLRTYAKNIKGTSYSESRTVTTMSGAASVTLNVDNSTVTASSVSSIITLTNDGGGIIQSCGVCWSESPYPTIQGNKVVAGGKKLNTQYICNITDLEPQTTYYVRAYATTEVSTEYSTQTTIQTTEGKPKVTTSQADIPGENYLTITGNVQTADDAPITQQGVCWSTIPNPTLNDNVVYASGLSSPFSCRIEGLQKGTKYYCKAFATNRHGTTLGNQIEATTDYGPAIIKGHVYDQDGFPVSGVSVAGNRLSATTDQNGYYEITTNLSIPRNYDLKASKDGYTEQEKRVHVDPGQVVEEDYTIELIDAYEIDLGTGFFEDGASRMIFECRYSSLVGQTTTRTMRIRNNRSVPINWSLQGVPSVGARFSSTSGTVPAKSEISVTVTFTYPTTSARMINLSGCASGTKAYLWNWDNMAAGVYAQILDNHGNWSIAYDNCVAVCEQNIFINLDQVQAGFTLTFNQFVTYR